MTTCELILNSNSKHLQQIFTGFSILAQKGLIKLRVTFAEDWNEQYALKPLVTCILNQRHTILYDTLDGFNFIDGENLETNLEHLSGLLKTTDYYFKRSYNRDILAGLAESEKIMPLGLNYFVTDRCNFAENMLFPGQKRNLKQSIKKNRFLGGLFKDNDNESLYPHAFEYLPQISEAPLILYMVRAWNPEVNSSPEERDEREGLNQMKVACIRLCKKEFGEHFYGGIIRTAYAQKHYPDALLPDTHVSGKLEYLKKVKQADICIATTGLHGSIGWKFAEYMAASKAIVTEKLNYSLPGDFAENRHYLSFSTPEECLSQVKLLAKDEKRRFTMMKENYYYYTRYVRPDSLVLQSLLTVMEKIGLC